MRCFIGNFNTNVNQQNILHYALIVLPIEPDSPNEELRRRGHRAGFIVFVLFVIFSYFLAFHVSPLRTLWRTHSMEWSYTSVNGITKTIVENTYTHISISSKQHFHYQSNEKRTGRWVHDATASFKMQNSCSCTIKHASNHYLESYKISCSQQSLGQANFKKNSKKVISVLP